MASDKGIPILDGKIDGEQLSGTIAKNALKAITEYLVKMENEGVKPEVVIEKCIWPIIYEAARRFESIAKKDFDGIPEDGFEYVVG